ncbi:MAG: hypothetical protein ABR511_14090 [Acidimicrobiales bacterium]
MADDERLLALLQRALAPEEVEPPDERVAAVRLRAGGRASGVAEVARVADDPWAVTPAVSAPAPAPSSSGGLAALGPPDGEDPWALPRPGPIPARGRGRGRGRVAGPRPGGRAPGASRGATPDSQHRVGWLVAGLAVAAAVLVVGALAVPSLVGHHHGAGGVAASATRSATDRLRIAIASQDPVAVAKADSALLRQAQGRRPAGGDAVAGALSAHSDALAFLRDHPDPAALSQVATPSTAPPVAAAPVPTTTRPAPPSTTTVSVPVSVSVVVPSTTGPAATVPPGPRTVAITGVHPLLDGTFSVDFTTSGFTPDTSARPGTWSVRFSFDEGQAPTLWAGSSPWTFPQANGIVYQRVCARVADAAGVEDPATGGCHPIL